jgi:hypothetical protein
MSHRRWSAATLLLALSAALASTGSASAAATCAYDAGTHQVTVTITTSSGVRIVRDGNNVVIGDPSPLACGTQPTVTNTDKIVVNAPATAGAVGVTTDLSGGALAPGFTDEPGASDEIELAIHLFGAEADFVLLTGSAGNDTWRLGQVGKSAGANLNAGSESSGADVDLTFDGLAPADRLYVNGGTGNNSLREDGGPEFGGPITFDHGHLVGAEGNDTLVGGSGADEISDGAGNDFVAGGRGTTRSSSHRWRARATTCTPAAPARTSSPTPCSGPCASTCA